MHLISVSCLTLEGSTYFDCCLVIGNLLHMVSDYAIREIGAPRREVAFGVHGIDHHLESVCVSPVQKILTK